MTISLAELRTDPCRDWGQM